MKSKLTIVAFFIAFSVLAVQLASATITITISAPSTVTQGSDIPITASFVASEGDSGTFYFTCDQTAAGEVDPEDGYSVTTSTSKTYTFTPSQATTYTNCKVSDGGTQSSSPTTIESVAPSTLTVSGTPSTYSGNGSFTLAINITNPTGDAITTSYELTCGFVASCSGDQTSANINIGSGSTTALSWTADAQASGTITFQLGSNSDAFSTTVTYPSATTTTTSTTLGFSPTPTTTITVTTTTTLPPVTEMQNVSSVAANANATFVFTKSDSFKIQSITLNVKNALTSISTTVKESLLPSGAAAPIASGAGSVYKYMEVTKGGFYTDQDINNAYVKFKVDKIWIAGMEIDKNTIILYRYDSDGNSWDSLPTTLLSEDNDYVYYEAVSPGLSIYAIAGSEVVATTTTTAPPATEPSPLDEEISPGVPRWLLVLVIIIVAVISFVIILVKGQFIKMPGKGAWDDLYEKYKEEGEEGNKSGKSGKSGKSESDKS